jgi:hypothetical protein
LTALGVTGITGQNEEDRAPNNPLEEEASYIWIVLVIVATVK